MTGLQGSESVMQLIKQSRQARHADDPERAAELVLLGEEHVARAVAQMPRVAPDEVVRELRRTAEKFTAGPLDDDLCIVAFRAEAA